MDGEPSQMPNHPPPSPSLNPTARATQTDPSSSPLPHLSPTPPPPPHHGPMERQACSRGLGPSLHVAVGWGTGGGDRASPAELLPLRGLLRSASSSASAAVPSLLGVGGGGLRGTCLRAAPASPLDPEQRVRVPSPVQERPGTLDEGSTALMILVKGNQISFGYLGDCSSVIWRNGQAIALSTDHEPSVPGETLGIASVLLSGGASITVSRSIGDMRYQDKIDLTPDLQALTTSSEIHLENITDDTEIHIMASDGIWDVVLNQGLVGCVWYTMKDECPGPLDDGSTALVVLIKSNLISFGNPGDCLSLLSRNAQSIALSTDHKPSVPGETPGIARGASRIIDGISDSRSIGDMRYKNQIDLSPDQQALTYCPEIHLENTTDEAEIRIMACDGIWDVMLNQAVVGCVCDTMKDGTDLAANCQSILDMCIGPLRPSYDNMTIILIRFKHAAPAPADPQHDRQEHGVADDTKRKVPLEVEPGTSGSARKSAHF